MFFFCRHDRPSDPDDPLSNQNIKDRYYGVNDPVANKLMSRASAMPTLEPPEDNQITTLYVAGLDDPSATAGPSGTVTSAQDCTFLSFSLTSFRRCWESQKNAIDKPII